MWDYNELYSCPLVIIMDVFKTRDFTVYVTLPLLNYRLNVLRKNNDYRIVHNIPIKDWYNKVMETCLNIVHGDLRFENVRKLLYANTMFYGGLNIYIGYGEKLILASLDYINTSKFSFYLKPSSKIRETPRSSLSNALSDWLILQVGLREGIEDMVFKACSELTAISGDCIFETSHGLLKITRRDESLGDWLRIIPDNNPFRHVILREQGEI